MSQLIKFKRGLQAHIPSTAQIGEPLFATDSHKLFFGLGASVVPVVAYIVNGSVTTEKILNGNVTALKLNSDTAGSGLVQTENGALNVNVDNSTLTIDNDVVKVKTSGITNTQIADHAITFGKVATAAITTDLTVSATSTQFATAEAVKAYVDTLGEGYSPKLNVVAATTGPITLANLQTVDLVELTAGQHVLVKNQVNPIDNGIYVVVDGGPWTRATEFDGQPDTEVYGGCFIFVQKASVANLNGENGFAVSAIGNVDVGTDPINLIQVSGAGQIVDGAGLGKDGNELFVKLDGVTLDFAEDEDTIIVPASGIDTLQLANDSVTRDKINSDVAGAGLKKDTNGSLAVIAGNGITVGSTVTIDLDGETLAVGVNGLKVADAVISRISGAELAVEQEATDRGTAFGLISGAVQDVADDLAQEITDRGTADGLLRGRIEDLEDGTFGVDAENAIKDIIGNAVTSSGHSVTMNYASHVLSADVKVDGVSIKVNVDNELYVDVVDGGTWEV